MNEKLIIEQLVFEYEKTICFISECLKNANSASERSELRIAKKRCEQSQKRLIQMFVIDPKNAPQSTRTTNGGD